MIRAVIILNTQGKPRLIRFYEFKLPEKQQELIRSIYGVLSERPENVSNFVQVDTIFGPDTKLVYKHFATLYFVVVFDSSENELAMLDLIQVFVETLDRCFKNVCELDIVFNFNKMHTILDEIIFSGQVLETNSEEVMKAVEDIARLEKSSTAVSFHTQVTFGKARPVKGVTAGGGCSLNPHIVLTAQTVFRDQTSLCSLGEISAFVFIECVVKQ